MGVKVLLTALAMVACSGCGDRRADAPLRGKAGHIAERPIAIDVYPSIAVCVASRRLDRSACERAQRIAMESHPRFAEKFPDRGVCEQAYAAGVCRRHLARDATFFSPLPAGFLVCRAAPGGCDHTIFAPVYSNRAWGEFTGAGGGFVSKSVTEPGRYTVSGVVGTPPVP